MTLPGRPHRRPRSEPHPHPRGVDGDGGSEIVVRGSYYEGGWTTLYRIRGTAVQPLVTVGCGS
jgi:hypothetical protein